MTTLSRRDFARFLSLTGTALLVPGRALADGIATPEQLGLTAAPLPPTPAEPDENYWKEVRARFLVPHDFAFLNAANVCPTSLPVVESMERYTRSFEGNPSPVPRSALFERKEHARRLIATALRVTPEEIVIPRNTSEANNLVSSGLQLGAGDEVVLFSDNHASNLNAWRDKARRFGYTVVEVQQVNPHPGTDYYVSAFAKAFTPRTRVLAFSHVSSNSGDLLPAAELCAAARARGVLSLVDGAQTFGVLDVDLSAMRPDFYTGSASKWPCGPKEMGLLFVNSAVHDRLWPSVVSLYPGAVGISRTMEANGQRDDASLAAFATALEMQGTIGRAVIERRSRQLAQRLAGGLSHLKGVTMWTHRDPTRSVAIIVFKPGSLDPTTLGTALREKERIIGTVRASADRPGLRFSPHFFNTMDEMDRTVAAVEKYLRM